MRCPSRSALLCLLTLTLAACEDSSATTQPTSTRERQDAALRDPFGYSPNMKQGTDIAGGGTMQFDRDGFKRDTNDLLNP